MGGADSESVAVQVGLVVLFGVGEQHYAFAVWEGLRAGSQNRRGLGVDQHQRGAVPVLSGELVRRVRH